MSPAILALVLVSATLHASWNFAVKRSSGSLGTTWLGLAVAALAISPLALAVVRVRPLDGPGLGYVAATGLFHALYFRSVARLYNTAEISLAYPLSRGLGVGGAILGALLLLGEAVRPLGAVGMLTVVAGILCSGGGAGRPSRAVARRILLVAAIIAAFTLVDKCAVARVHPVVYIWGMFLLPALLLAPAALAERRRRGLADSQSLRDLPAACLIGPGSMASYLLILFAYTLGPLAYVVAAREVSVVIGSGLGFLLLGERPTRRRAVGVTLIAAGLFLIKAAG